jgi:hypothetical protein
VAARPRVIGGQEGAVVVDRGAELASAKLSGIEPRFYLRIAVRAGPRHETVPCLTTSRRCAPTARSIHATTKST